MNFNCLYGKHVLKLNERHVQGTLGNDYMHLKPTRYLAN